MRAAFVALSLLALVVLPSLVVGSHNMGHRYLVSGRLLDANGMPVQGQAVEVRLMDGDNLRSSLSATTDCLGDFESWKGTVLVRQGSGVEHGAGEIEGPAPVPNSNEQYINIHFHDQYLSDRLDIEFRIGNDTWREDFSSARRQTIARHQLSDPYPPTPACGGNYDQFNRTLSARVYISTAAEQNTAEVQVKARTVNVSFGPDAANGPTHAITSSFFASLENGTIREGEQVTVVGTDIGTKRLRLSAEDAKYHRIESINVLGGTGGNALDDFKYVGVGLIIIAILIGLYIGGNRMRDKMAERRLRETSTRRRFRRENKP